MSQVQFMGLLRAIVPAMIAYVVGKGWIPAGIAGDLAAAVMALAAAGWSMHSNTSKSIVTAAAALPEVAGVVTHKTEEGIALASSIDGPVVPAGSSQATKIAQA